MDATTAAAHARRQVSGCARRVAVVVALTCLPVAAAAQVNPQAAAQQDFQVRLQVYLELRAMLARTIQPLSSSDNAVELAGRQRALAAAIARARAGAKNGDLIPPAVGQQIAATVTADMKKRPVADQKAAFEEVPFAARPRINTAYPAGAALATVPPLLLNNLPRLPDNLQYRFFGRHIVLLDGDTDLILDYLLNVLPPLAQNDPEH